MVDGVLEGRQQVAIPLVLQAFPQIAQCACMPGREIGEQGRQGRGLRFVVRGGGLVEPRREHVEVADVAEQARQPFHLAFERTDPVRVDQIAEPRSSLRSRRVVVRRRWMPSTSPRRAAGSMPRIRDEGRLERRQDTRRSTGSRGLMLGDRDRRSRIVGPLTAGPAAGPRAASITGGSGGGMIVAATGCEPRGASCNRRVERGSNRRSSVTR